jgi:hypothetical protein
MLIGRAILRRKTPAPQRGINLDDGRASRRSSPKPFQTDHLSPSISPLRLFPFFITSRPFSVSRYFFSFLGALPRLDMAAAMPSMMNPQAPGTI